jgi:hypothetical protein
MASKADQLRRVRRVKVILDGQPVDLPRRALSSLVAVSRQLELMASRRERFLSSLQVDGVPVNWRVGVVESGAFCHVQATTVSVADLSRQLASAACGAIAHALERVNDTVALVMINQWPAVVHLVKDLLIEVRTPLILIGFLYELGGIDLEKITLDQETLGDHLNHLTEIWDALEACEAQEDNWILSDLLEQRLARWLGRLSSFLEAVA